ncbi:MAG: Hsp33 family molecular chaperone [Pseudomonadota bacterium]
MNRQSVDVALDSAADDLVIPFAIEGLEVRGRIVRLGHELDVLLKRHAYPEPVSALLAEAVTLTVLLGASLKFDGRFILQTQSDGPVDMMVVDYETPGQIRACARIAPDRRDEIGARRDGNLAKLLGRGTLAMTIDQGPHMSRYQGVVPLEGESLEAAARLYFQQSEQIPTEVRLAVAETYKAGGGQATTGWRSGGIMIQHLPESGGDVRRDLPPGDVPDGVMIADVREDDHWSEARLLLETVEDHELLDPDIAAGRLLYRLYHERAIRVFDAQPIAERCRCSRDKIETLIGQFSEEERADMIQDDRIVVTCEFCSSVYEFPADVFDSKPETGPA